MDDQRFRQRVGTTVRDKWTLERLLGVGGMASVYAAMHRIGRYDALKILHPEAAQSKDVCRRFELEAQAVNRFRHPGAVEIRDIDVTEQGEPFLVMELLTGESLAEHVTRRGGISLGELLDVVEQALDTLVAAHAQGIVHRDIKPANLHVLEGGRVKVLDFGLARIRQEGSQSWTQAGMALGTTPYMPPEQAKGRDIDARADLFAVGATLFRLITGRHIHEASSDFDLLVKMGREPAPPLRSVAPTAPRELALVVDRALSFDRAERYAEAQLMLEDVRALRRGETPAHAARLAGPSSSIPTRPEPLNLSDSDVLSVASAGSSQEIPIYLDSVLIPGRLVGEAPPVAPLAAEVTKVSPTGTPPPPPPATPLAAETTAVSPVGPEPPKGTRRR